MKLRSEYDFTSEDMNVFKMKTGRYLLYLDILGFSQIVEAKSESHVYGRIDAMLTAFEDWSKVNRDFGVLYFSDTVVFYQLPQGWGSWAFSDVYAIGSMVWSTLAAAGIATRGAISFGPLTVEASSSGKHNVFFGMALVEAYKTESAKDSSDWIGLSICPSAWQAVEYAEPGTVAMLQREGRLRRHGNLYRLNPFIRLGSPLGGAYFDWHAGQIDGPLSQWMAPEFSNEVKALTFLRAESQNTGLPEDVRVKYLRSLEEIQAMVEPDVYQWATGISDQFV
jgi:hypothetical protein